MSGDHTTHGVSLHAYHFTDPAEGYEWRGPLSPQRRDDDGSLHNSSSVRKTDGSATVHTGMPY
jgi:hypothetical protein